nr:tetratricopeptide repeat protein 27 homolog isoform X2 [Ipomoea trifida]
MTAEEIREDATKTHSAFHIDNCNLVMIFSKPLDIGILLRCSLGDVTNSDSCYEKAQEVSGNKSARAPGVCNENELYVSLYLDGWFALGAAALKETEYFRFHVLVSPSSGISTTPFCSTRWDSASFASSGVNRRFFSAVEEPELSAGWRELVSSVGVGISVQDRMLFSCRYHWVGMWGWGVIPKP